MGEDESFEVALPLEAPKRVDAPKRAGTIVVNAGAARFVQAPRVAVKAITFEADDSSSAVAAWRRQVFRNRPEGKLAVCVKDADSLATITSSRPRR